MNRSILTDGKFESHAQAKVSDVCQPELGLPLAQEHVPRKESLQAEVECGDGCANCRKLEQEIRALKEECNHWQAKAKYCKKQLHGRKSEKSEPQSEPCKAPIKRSVSSQKRGAQPGCKGHGRTPREPLPRVEQVLDAAPQDRVCPSCGLPCQAVSGTDDCEVLESVVQAVVRRFRRARHARSCQCPESPPMITAAPPERVIPKGLLGVSVWTQILLQKYLHSRSTGNLLTEMGHQGMPLSPGTVCDGLKRLSVLFQPLFEELLKHQMGEQAFHCDETGWKVHEPVAGKASNRWWLWVFHSPSSTIYRLEPTRSSKVPIDHFQDACSTSEEVVVICDRFGAYRRSSKKIESITLSYCWAHVRRDFLDAATRYRQLASWSQDWLQRIGSLHHLNQTRLAHWPADRSMADQSERFQWQQRLLEQAIESLEQTRQLEYLEEDIQPAQRKVLKSMHKHWTGLKVFVEHAPISMHNDTAERSIRNPAMLRKNCRGSGSFWSAGLAAMMFSTFQTPLQWRINPQHWLYACFQACAGQQGQVPLLQLHTFVPWQMSEERGQQLSQPIDMRRDLGLDPCNGILFKEIHTFTNFIEWQLIDSRDINIYFKKSIKNLLTNACAFPIILCIALCSLGQ